VVFENDIALKQATALQAKQGWVSGPTCGFIVTKKACSSWFK
jgi:hypothetical protein